MKKGKFSGYEKIVKFFQLIIWILKLPIRLIFWLAHKSYAVLLKYRNSRETARHITECYDLLICPYCGSNLSVYKDCRKCACDKEAAKNKRREEIRARIQSKSNG